MASTCSILLLFQCSIFFFTSATSATDITRDQSALLKFKSSIVDQQRLLEDWTLNKPVCKWKGVLCSTSLQRVTALDISNMTLSGDIAPGLGNLSFLVSLNMEDNGFTGDLPEDLVHLQRLKLLNLTSNNFVGKLPVWFSVLSLGSNSILGEIPQEIGNLKKLIMLDLQLNQLSGPLPNTIYNLTLLETISVSNNSLSGNIPTDLCHYLPRLKGIFLAANQLVGGLPTSLHRCSHLQTLSVQFNELSGSIPNYIGNLTLLRRLELHENNFSGKVPEDIGNLEQLENLYLGDNSFSGVIPVSIANCSKLKIFAIYNNQFTSSLSKEDSALNELSFITSMTRCRNLKYFDFSGNPIYGFLPNSIGNFSASLQFFQVNNCEINGIIPDEVGNLSSLIVLSVGMNNLSGSIPSSIKELVNLQMLDISDTGITGPISLSLCDLQYATIMYLGSNRLTGNIPACLGSISSLRYLHLYNNMLESSIPLSLWNLIDLLELLLDENRLNGSLPDEVGNLVSVTWLDLSKNRFSGNIPSALGDMKSLQTLYLQENSLEGSIPDTISEMYSLEVLDISNNNLSGAIPESLTRLLYLKYFNVSFNKLVGEIPTKGPFANFDASYFSSNVALCGSSRYHVPPCYESSSESSKRRKVPWWIFILAGFTFVIIVIALLSVFRKRSKRPKRHQVVERNQFTTTRRITYYDLLQATEDYSLSNLLGRGGFSTVYKGVLNDGIIVAVKVFKLEVQGAIRSFDVECEVLCSLRHRNLTKVITSCSNGDDFKALVLEYMTNGSLEKWLHSENHFLDMLQRLSIMVDISQALEYLHYGYSTPIIHCDIKPSNVLLDENMTARLCDFGLTQFLNEEASFTHTNTLATIGYIAPEYGSQGIVSRAGDVYSFGILLMETFTKKKPSEEMLTQNGSLKEWVYAYILKDQLIQVHDIDLLTPNEQETNQQIQTLSSIMELALNCCAESPKERMNIKDVRMALEKIKLAYVSHV